MSAIFSAYLGEICALSAALLWAVATILYARTGERISPLRMNLLKNIMAALMVVATLWLGGSPLPAIGMKAGVLFFISGGIGIGLGDSAYFGALRFIGARRVLLLMVLSPPLTAVISLIFLGESLGPWAWMGIAVTVAGIAWVITERVPGRPFSAGPSGSGLMLGLTAVLAQAAGSVVSRMVFMETPVSPLASSLFRLLGGLAVVIICLPFDRSVSNNRSKNHLNASSWGLLLTAVFIGTYIGIWLQQVSLKYSPAGIAQTLFTTSPLFVLPLAAFQGERISLRAVWGAIIAVGGVALLFLP